MGHIPTNISPPPTAPAADARIVAAALAEIDGKELQELRTSAGALQPLAPHFCRWLAYVLFREGRRRSHGEGEPFAFPAWEPADVGRGLLILQSMRAFPHGLEVSRFLAAMNEMLIRFAATMLDPDITTSEEIAND